MQTSDVTPAIQKKIKQWQEKLADLSKRNRLLYFQPDKNSTIKILDPDLASIFETLAAEEPQTLPVKDLNTQPTKTQLTKFLQKLRNDSNSLLKEKGVNSLFIALNTLTWKLAEKPQESVVSPILLIPVELRKSRGKDEYTLERFDENIFINPVLIQKLKTDFGINFPENEEIQESNYHEILKIVHQTIANAGNSDWKIEDTAYISLFSGTKTPMIKDLDNAEKIAIHPILQALAGDLTAYELTQPKTLKAKDLDKQVDPKSVFQILEADSSQQVVIEAVKVGLSFVIQGPPGTGKSQTIANMIAELIGNRKRVLVVAEKETALEVVLARLKDCDLEDICLYLHHQGKTNKKDFYKHLDETMVVLKM